MALLNDILDLSKIEAGKVQFEATAFAPEALLYETCNLFAVAAHAKGLAIEFHWQGAAQQRYQADAMRLRQMLSNLVGNAIKFTASGSVQVQASEVRRDGDAAALEFAVTDTGMGIAADKMHLLFKPFSQADSSTTRAFGGSGLGLSIVNTLARAMGGEVGVESRVGQGSRFWFRVPAQALSEGLDACQNVRPDALPARAVTLSGRVLVAEDDLFNGQVILAFLSQMGVQATLAPNGQQTIAAVTQCDPSQYPDLILMDVHMPVMDGYATTQQIRQWEEACQRKPLPIIALTADAFEEARLQCLAVGMDDVLTKPVEFEVLAGRLARWLTTTPVPGSLPGIHAANQPVDRQQLAQLISEISPMLERHSFDAMRRFRLLKDLLADTDLAPQVAQMETELKALRFDLVLAQLQQLNP